MNGNSNHYWRILHTQTHQWHCQSIIEFTVEFASETRERKRTVERHETLTKNICELFAPHRHIIQTGNPTSHEWLRICICICIGWFMAEIGGVVVVAAAGAFLSFRFHTSAWKCPVCRVRYQTAFEVIGNSVGVCGHYENWHLRFETIDTLTLVLLVCVWVCHHMETVPGQAPVWSKNEEKERISSGHLHFWNIYNGIVGCTFQTCVISFFISLR